MILRVDMRRMRSLVPEDALILCGAGISIPSPTSLPAGDALRNQTITMLLQDRENADLVDRLMDSPRFRAMLPEAALQEVAYFAPSHVDRFVSRCLGNIPSNHIHRLIADRFSIVFTTNFDLCLEACGAKTVHHLHGSVDRPNSLQNRLWRIGKTEQTSLSALSAILPGTTLLVVGYSMRDLDVFSAIASLTDLKIGYLSFDGEIPSAMHQLQCDIVWAQGTLMDLYEQAEVQAADCARCPPSVSQPKLSAKALSLLYLASTIGDLELFQEFYSFYATRLTGKLQLRAMAIYADTLRAGQRFEAALEVCRRAKKLSGYRRSSNLDVVSNILGIEALVEDEGGGDKIRARSLIRKAFGAMKKFGRLSKALSTPSRVAVWRAKLANNLGNLERNLGNFRRAEFLYRYSMRIKLEFSEEVAAAQTASNISA